MSSLYDLPRPTSSGFFADRPHLPYLIPLMAFMLLMGPGGVTEFAGVHWKDLWHAYHPFVYASKTVVAAVLLWWFWRYYTPVRWNGLGLGVVVGLIGVPLWVGTEYAAQAMGLRSPVPLKDIYNPDIELHTQAARWLFLVIRVAGPTLVVPPMEELFYRDFLMRAFVRGPRFDDVPVGTFTWFSFLGVPLVFAISHIQWPSAILWALVMGALVVRTKSIGSCIVAHAVTNLVLYLYVIYTGDWQFM